jgi:hypothetical protein
MKKILHYFKKIIFAVLMGLSASFGKQPIEMEKRDNKTIGANK